MKGTLELRKDLLHEKVYILKFKGSYRDSVTFYVRHPKNAQQLASVGGESVIVHIVINDQNTISLSNLSDISESLMLIEAACEEIKPIFDTIMKSGANLNVY